VLPCARPWQQRVVLSLRLARQHEQPWQQHARRRAQLCVLQALVVLVGQQPGAGPGPGLRPGQALVAQRGLALVAVLVAQRGRVPVASLALEQA
jgi:hypothetical protein